MTNAFVLRKRQKRDTEVGKRVAFSASGVGGNAKIGIRFYGKGSASLEVNVCLSVDMQAIVTVGP